MSASISAMVACYDEAATLERAVEEVLEALERTGRPHEVVIVDDGSTDGSGAIADELEVRYEAVRVVHHERNLGLGGFYRTALREARCDIVYFMAADLQPIPGEYFPRYLPLLERHDLVVGFDPEREAPLLSRLLSLGERLVFACLFPGVPKIGGPLMMRRTLIDAHELVLMGAQDRSWLVLWELLVRAKRSGASCTRIPVRQRPRAVGTTKGSTVRTAFVMLSRLGELRRALAR